MSEQVIATVQRLIKSGDVAAAEMIEALRAENERLNGEASESLSALVNQRDAARTELEAARGLLRVNRERLSTISAHRMTKPADWCATFKAEIRSVIEQIDTFLTATPAPEVRCQTCDGTGDVHRADGEWLGECHCVKAEQGERQEAQQKPVGHVFTMQPCFPGEPMRAHAQLHVALPAGTKLYAQPQPGPDVRGLVDALEQVRMNDSESARHGIGATYWNNAVIACQCAIRDIDEDRQAQQGGSHDT